MHAEMVMLSAMICCPETSESPQSAQSSFFGITSGTNAWSNVAQIGFYCYSSIGIACFGHYQRDLALRVLDERLSSVRGDASG